MDLLANYPAGYNVLPGINARILQQNCSDPLFESVICQKDHDALQDHCAYCKYIQGSEGDLPLCKHFNF